MFSHLYWKFSFWYRRSPVPGILKELLTSERLPPEIQESSQKQRLSTLLRHCASNVPYYRDIFKDAGISKPEDIQDSSVLQVLPPLTKKIIRENRDALLAENISKDTLIANFTGGTTGEPLHFYQDQNYRDWNQATRLRGWYHNAGFRPGSKVLRLWGAPRDLEKAPRSGLMEYFNFFRIGEVLINTFELSGSRLNEICKKINHYRPEILIGYAGSLLTLARYLNERRENVFHPSAIIYSAEGLTDSERSEVEKAFDQKIYNSYGGREFGLTAIECHAHDGLHIQAETQYIELYNIQEDPAHGKVGEILITNLVNFGMPFLRYRIGDLASAPLGGFETCSCGRTLPRVKNILGREVDSLVLKDGGILSPACLIHFIGTYKGVKEYFITQELKGQVEVKLVLAAHDPDATIQGLEKLLQKETERKLDFTFIKVDRIEKPPSGKRRFIINKIDSSINK